MRTLDLNQAAALVKLHPVTLQSKAKTGEVPAAKPGKCWVFIEEDLIEWLRSQYNSPWQDVSKEKLTCSLKEKTRITGISSSPSKDARYTDLLAPATKASRRR